MSCDHHDNDCIGEEQSKIKQHHAGVVRQIAGNTVFVDVDEAHEDIKVQALEAALAKLDVKTRRRLDGLNVYLGPAVRCVAYCGTLHGGRTYTIFLGDQMLIKTATLQTEAATGVKGGVGKGRGVADQRYDAMRKSKLSPARLMMGKDAYQTTKIAAKAMAVIVHEFGHLLHEANDPNQYWRLKNAKNDRLRDGEVQTATKVSYYPIDKQSRLEFVAEVF